MSHIHAVLIVEAVAIHSMESVFVLTTNTVSGIASISLCESQHILISRATMYWTKLK